MAKLKEKVVIGIKIEATQGTAVPVTATDFLLAEDVSIAPSLQLLQRNSKRNSLDQLAHVVGKRHFEVSFKTEVKGSGTAGTAYAPLDALMQACGFSSTTVAVTSVTYAPISSPPSSNFYGPGKSVSIEVYLDGIKHVAAGCVGDVSIQIEAGGIAYYHFTLKGLYAQPTDTTAGTQTYNATLPAIVESASFSALSFAAIISKLEISAGNTISERPSASAAGGLLGFSITDRNPKGSFDPEAETIATHDFYNKLIAGTQGIVTVTIGATAGNITTISCPKAQYAGLKSGNRNGFLTFEIPLVLAQSTGDDWVSIALT